MDKLEPILKQKFWIILGIGVIMTITGWWMATGSLAATITQRKDTLKKVEESIPSGEVPNNDWSTKLSQINNRQEAMVSSVRRALWEQQKATYFWPLHVDEYAQDAKYRAELGLEARELYRSNYQANAEEVWKRARPINRLDGSGIVMFPFEKMPKKVFGQLAPRSDEIWDAQEDLWLLVPILDAIREVNGGESGTRLDAVVHIIDRLELMGGERSAGEGGGGSSPMGSGYPGPAEGGMAGMESGYSGGLDTGTLGGVTGGRGATATPKVAADFDFKEEFGSTGVAMGGGGGGSFFGESADYANAMGSADGPSGGSSGSTAPTVRRYIDDAENLPYKTRGFYLSVVMDHRKVPNLIGELTANGVSPWPIEIVRVQISRINDDDNEGRGLSTGGLMAGAPGGSAGYAGGETYSPESAIGLNETPSYETYGTEEAGGVGYPGGAMQAQGGLSFEAALADPFMARVALAGLIYIYTEPNAAAEPVSEPATAPVTAETEQPLPGDPATPAPTEADTPAATEPATPSEGAPTPPPAAPTPETPEPQPTPESAPAPTPSEPAPTAPVPESSTAPPPN